MQDRQSLNGRKYIQLKVKTRKIPECRIRIRQVTSNKICENKSIYFSNQALQHQLFMIIGATLIIINVP